MAKTIAAAPLNPTHETNILSLVDLLKNDNIINTATGLAINIINAAVIKPLTAIPGNCDGNTKSPSVKNNIICINQDIPSKYLTKFIL